MPLLPTLLLKAYLLASIRDGIKKMLNLLLQAALMEG